MGFNSTQQYGQAPIGRFSISLRANRTNGETFPALQGMFFYVESVDLPCRVSFNNSDDTQSVGLSSGFQLNMPFSGITLFHDDYSTAGASNQPFTLNLYVSRDPRAFNQFVNPTVQYPVPYKSNGIAGAFLTTIFPIFSRTRFFNLDSVIGINALGNPGVAISQLVFYDKNNLPIESPYNIFKTGILYTGKSILAPAIHEATEIIVNSQYGYTISKRAIPIPTFADFVALQMGFQNGNPGALVFEIHSPILS